ncbi:serine hydrolase domain-containing protein [Actinoplanes sp. CA-030573]|uniref:serine hydrolase domain-containing protein n=1 Tax=Actinoplanes sp. CA-030573 TaxID=3239898 RepID=UPI003D8E0700
MRLVTIMVAALVAVPAGATSAAASAADRSRPDRQLQQLLDAVHAAGMPGLFAEVRDGHDTWRGASGLADVRTGRPADPASEHRIGSITKTFVATTVLQLVGEHRVRLDAPIGRYLPDVVGGRLGREVTVRMLLNHTSGIGNYTDALLATPEDIVSVGKRTFTPEELVAIGLALPPTGPPGARFSYTNTGYIILGLLIERITGHPYAAEVSRRILRPLRLRHTYFPGTNPYLPKPHLNAYVVWTDGRLRDFTVYNMSWGWSAGEMISTAHDLNVFYRALLSGRLLRPSLLAQMKTTVPFDPNAPERGGYGLGIGYMDLPCGRIWGHGGGVIGHTTESLHSEDGSRQVTEGENLIGYETEGQPSPIDDARVQFLLQALCGTAGNATLRFTPRDLQLRDRLPMTTA